ncbi:MAG: hypothetical protein Q4F56_03155 [Candidatus Saccharibacteria bacterium]|nr:hypothetical protein [Candidatus Saccharibacteria bacterium]
MPDQSTGTFFDVDPENWKEVVDVPLNKPDEPADEQDDADLDSLERPAVIYFDTAPYWYAAVDVINAWSKYQSVKKLYVNATHGETRHRVWSVVASKKYYNGSVQRVSNREKELFYLVQAALGEFKTICQFYGVEPVDLDWLYDHLKESKDYASYRNKCKRRAIQCKPAVSLKEL